MYLDYRKVIRDTVLSALAVGFNQRVVTLAGYYGIPPFEIDFSATSTSFIQTYVDESNIESSNLQDFSPVAGCLYTDEAEDTGNPRGLAFTGATMLCLDWFVRPREGAESNDTESLLDMIENAALTTLLVAIPGHVEVGNTGVWRSRRAAATRERLVALSDGYFTKVKIRDQFAANVSSL